MKIGILTFHYSDNYGGVLQCYALLTYLKQLGHDAWIIDRRKTFLDRYKMNRSVSNIYVFFKIFIIKFFFANKFKSFRKEFLHPKTKQVYSNEELTSLCDKGNFDAIIVGSDQVWRLSYTRELGYNYFLDFVPDNILKISYAASFGKDDFEGDSEQIFEIRKLLSKFDAISVREKSGIEICRTLFKVDAVNVLDPTLLLYSSEYKNIMDIANKDPDIEKSSYIAYYFLDINKEKEIMLHEISERYSIKQKRNIFIKKQSGSKFSQLLRGKYVFPAVGLWLSDIDNAKFVVTDSFHGMIFSIIFKKQFIVIGNKGRGLARFSSLLSKLGIEQRLALDLNDVREIIAKNDVIDYSVVCKYLDLERASSISFLNDALSKAKMK